MSDEVVTWHEVAKWLPADVRDALLAAMPPEQRGWWTEAEADADGGRFVEVTDLSHRESRYYKTGGIMRQTFLPTIGGATAPTTAELNAGVQP